MQGEIADAVEGGGELHRVFISVLNNALHRLLARRRALGGRPAGGRLDEAHILGAGGDGGEGLQGALVVAQREEDGQAVGLAPAAAGRPRT